jgi:lysozyme family protein
MPDPINYLSMIQPVNIAESLGQGLQVGEALHDRFKVRPQLEADQQQYRQLALTAARDKLAREAQYQQDVSSVIKNPTPEGYRGLLVAYPEQHEALKAAWDGYSADEKDRNLKAATGVYGALANNKPDLALDLLRNRKQALADAGEDTTETDHLISLLESGDPEQVKAAKGIAGFVIAGAVGPDKVGSTLEALGGSIGERKGQVVGRAIGHYDENGKWVLDYRDPEEFTLSKGQARFSGDGGGSAPSSGAVQDGKLDPHQFFADFVAPHEGGFNPSDANGSPTNFGINQAAHPEVDVKTLTKDQAADIFAKDYFQASGADKLPPALAAVHADTSYINPAMAKRFLTASGGDPQKYMDMRETWMKSMVAREPQKFGKYDKAWTNRNADLRQFAQQVGSGAGGGPRQIASVPDEAGGADVPGNQNLTGEPYLATLPPALGNRIRGIVSGKLPYPPQGRGTNNTLLAAISQYSPGFDATAWQRRKGTAEDYRPGGRTGQSLISAKTLINHLYELAEASEKLGGTSLKAVNWMHNAYRSETSDPVLERWNESRKFVATELPKFLAGKAPAEGEIQQNYESYSPNKGPEARKEAIRTDINYLAGRLQPLLDAYKDSMGADFDIDRSIPGGAVSHKLAAIENWVSGGKLAAPSRALGGHPPAPSASPDPRSNLPRIGSVAEAMKLPKGTHFLTPDGREKIRP